MTTVAVRTAKDQLSSLLDQVQRTHDRVVITRNGLPTGVLMSTEDLEALEETLDVLSSPGLLEDLAQGRRAVAAGDVVDEAGLQEMLAHRTA